MLVIPAYISIGEPLLIGMDMVIASFDSISEVNMVRCLLHLGRGFLLFIVFSMW